MTKGITKIKTKNKFHSTHKYILKVHKTSVTEKEKIQFSFIILNNRIISIYKSWSSNTNKDNSKIVSGRFSTLNGGSSLGMYFIPFS